MADQEKTIEHKGVIKDIRDGVIRVDILAESACAACHARGVCSLSESATKTIEIEGDSSAYAIGESVQVVLEQSSGYTALALGYLFPFAIVAGTLCISYAMTRREIVSGILSLLALIPYYGTLYVLRGRMKTTFKFRIKKATP